MFHVERSARLMRWGVGSAAALVVSVLAWGELVHWRSWARSRTLPAPPPESAGAVIVLGFANRGRSINTVNRWRAAIAVRTAERSRRSGSVVTIICSGGAVAGSVAEAILLRDFLTAERGWSGTIVVETSSTSTWENVRNTLPLVIGLDWISFASNGLHAEKACRYYRAQATSESPLLVHSQNYHLGEALVLKPIFAAVGLWRLSRAFHVEHCDQP